MTAIEDCPKCVASLQVPDEQVGGRVECPECGHWFTARALSGSSPVDLVEPAEPDRPRSQLKGRKRFCPDCGAPADRGDRRCLECGAPLTRIQDADLREAGSKKLTAGICAILLSGFGVHKFILGYTTAGIIMLLVTVLGGFVTCGTTSVIMSIIGIIEGIIYLTKSDEDFYDTYIANKKEWF